MHPEKIKAAIRMAGDTPSNIARRLGLSRSTVSKVIHGEGVSARVRAEIAALLRKPVASVWAAKRSGKDRRHG